MATEITQLADSAVLAEAAALAGIGLREASRLIRALAKLPKQKTDRLVVWIDEERVRNSNAETRKRARR